MGRTSGPCEAAFPVTFTDPTMDRQALGRPAARRPVAQQGGEPPRYGVVREGTALRLLAGTTVPVPALHADHPSGRSAQ
ncbi:hypothetical protein Amir_3122 [Actinosynnema mirum DSM 43827]|uniref:Uncharacterized protein n=2 Tax=Actinosynnema mirum TaxID=40567 RepID=C6W814_ACTMD|nr:hypothetical protein Amir_3122 [Actinosynnema mirum DSM 43827]